jgi:hypothetical protein
MSNPTFQERFDYLLETHRPISSFTLWPHSLNSEQLNYIFEKLKNNTYIIYLDLGHQRIEYSSAKVCAEMLKTNTTLKIIDLSFTTLDSACAKLLADALRVNKSVTHLLLQGNYIKETGLYAIGEMLQENDVLVQVDLSNNSCFLKNETTTSRLFNRLKNWYYNTPPVAGISSIVKAIQMNKTLMGLNLEGNYLRVCDLDSIEAAWETNTTLFTIGISPYGKFSSLALRNENLFKYRQALIARSVVDDPYLQRHIIEYFTYEEGLFHF